MTHSLIQEVISFFEREDADNLGLHDAMRHVCDDLQRELSLQLFIRIRSEHRERFESPFKGWEAIVNKFGDATRDIEEMNKCFSLCRYTAAMFHALQVAEWGAIAFGDRIGVTDPKKGWGPTVSKLSELIKGGHSKLPPNLAGKFPWLEQVNREISTMMFAWRHKVDHAANHLAIVPREEFTPDIAEHIIDSVKVFMSRLEAEI